MAFVVDASVALCWFLPGQENPQSIEILRRAKLEGVVVPFLWHIEVANQLGRKLRYGVISQDNVTFAIDLIAELDLFTDSFAWNSAADIVPYMNRYRLTAYDATYLFLTMSRSLPLATFDKELIAAAALSGITLLT